MQKNITSLIVYKDKSGIINNAIYTSQVAVKIKKYE